MRAWLQALDRVLRGDATRLANLREGHVDIPLGGMTVLIVALGAIYGFGMGSFALFKGDGPSFAQFFASAVKVPLLFLLTLLITFPSLYVFNALVGSRLTILSVLRLLVAGLAVIMAVLASFGPIVVFFAACTTSYPFMVLLNVLLCAVAGLLGMTFLRQTLHRLTVAPAATKPLPPPMSPPDAPEPATPGALNPVEGHVLGPHVRAVFRCWMLLFALVGSQMGWVLRPFVGEPGLPFTLFRARGSNFFQAVLEHFGNLFR